MDLKLPRIHSNLISGPYTKSHARFLLLLLLHLLLNLVLGSDGPVSVVAQSQPKSLSQEFITYNQIIQGQGSSVKSKDDPGHGEPYSIHNNYDNVVYKHEPSGYDHSQLFEHHDPGNGDKSGVNVSPTIPVVNLPLQITLLLLILSIAILANGSIILNITLDPLKLRMVHFILIRHVCITDTLGACMVLPAALGIVIKGPSDFFWPYSINPADSPVCSLISTSTAACWTMHLIAVALYRADRVLALWCPTGSYPVVSVKVANGLLVLLWLTAISGSYLATTVFHPNFQPALALCIPDVPLIFFILLFSLYCLGLLGLTTGYVFAFARRRRRKKKEKRVMGSSSGHISHNVHHLTSNLQCIHPLHVHIPHPKFPIRELGHNAPFEPEPSAYFDEDDDSSSSGSHDSSFEEPDLDPQSQSYCKNQGMRQRAFSDSRTLAFAQKEAIIKTPNFSHETPPFIHRRACSESSSSTARPTLKFSPSILSTITQKVAMSMSMTGTGNEDTTEPPPPTAKATSSTDTSSSDCSSSAGPGNGHCAYVRLEWTGEEDEEVARIEETEVDQFTKKAVLNNELHSKSVKTVHDSGSSSHSHSYSIDLDVNPSDCNTVTQMPPSTPPNVHETFTPTPAAPPPHGYKHIHHRRRPRLKHFRSKPRSSAPAKRALASYAVSIGHLLLYLPAMFVVGLQGDSLPPGVALFCGIVVYCDFLVQPVALLLISRRLRKEVKRTVSSLVLCCWKGKGEHAGLKGKNIHRVDGIENRTSPIQEE